jgi:predicted RNA-binding protein YlqC (UPF0109 family)
MEEFLRYVIGAIVERPEAVLLTKTETPGRVSFHLKVDKGDIPKVVGKGGHTIQALRTLLHASAQKKGVKANLEIIE